MVILANLLITRAVWRGGTDPLAEELKKEGERYWIKVFHSPPRSSGSQMRPYNGLP